MLDLLRIRAAAAARRPDPDQFDPEVPVEGVDVPESKFSLSAEVFAY